MCAIEVRLTDSDVICTAVYSVNPRFVAIVSFHRASCNIVSPPHLATDDSLRNKTKHRSISRHCLIQRCC